MWFIAVQPREPRAALLSVAWDGDDLLNFTVGNIWFEVFNKTPDELTAYAREVARAVFHGRVEESGFTVDAYGRVFVEDGPPMSVGRLRGHPRPQPHPQLVNYLRRELHIPAPHRDLPSSS